MTAQPDNFVDSVLEIGNRIQAAPSKLLIETVFAKELQHQQHLFHEMSLVDICYTLVGIEHEFIPETAGIELLTHLLALHQHPDSFILNAARGDLYTNREAWLAERTSSVGWLGVGRARREATTTAFLLHLRRLLTSLMQSLVEVGQALCQQAAQHRRSFMPDYTYLQVAQPTTLAHYLLGFAYPIVRDLQRLTAVFQHLNRSPLGCGSSNGARLFLGRERMAELLGFADLVVHARDAMWQADLPIELSAVLSSSMINFSRLAEDLLIFCSAEFALFELADCHARASKIMPQKKNPFALNAMRGLANETLGSLTTVTSLARTPSGQPDNRLAIYGILPDSIHHVQCGMLLMAEIIEKLHYNSDRGAAIIDSSWAMSTDFAEVLVQQCGLNFREAHQLVGYLAGRYGSQCSLTAAITPELLATTSQTLFGKTIQLDADALSLALDVDFALQQRQEAGGASESAINAMLAELNDQFADAQQQALSLIQRIGDSEAQLLQLAKQRISA
jgi:argininosuccinate lyase